MNPTFFFLLTDTHAVEAQTPSPITYRHHRFPFAINQKAFGQLSKRINNNKTKILHKRERTAERKARPANSYLITKTLSNSETPMVRTVSALLCVAAAVFAAACPAGADSSAKAAVPPPPPMPLNAADTSASSSSSSSSSNVAAAGKGARGALSAVASDENGEREGQIVGASGAAVCPLGGRAAFCTERRGCFLRCNPEKQSDPKDACEKRHKTEKTQTTVKKEDDTDSVIAAIGNKDLEDVEEADADADAEWGSTVICSLLPLGWVFCITEEPPTCGVDPASGAPLAGGYAPYVLDSASVRRSDLRMRFTGAD